MPSSLRQVVAVVLLFFSPWHAFAWPLIGHCGLGSQAPHAPHASHAAHAQPCMAATRPSGHATQHGAHADWQTACEACCLGVGVSATTLSFARSFQRGGCRIDARDAVASVDLPSIERPPNPS